MSDKLRETDEEDFWRGAYESLNKKKLREDIINALHGQHLHIDSRELGIVVDVVHAREKAHGWNIEQILVYIWQCESSEQTAEKYPYQRFRDSEMGQRLRRELAALAGAASVGAGDGVLEARLDNLAERAKDISTSLKEIVGALGATSKPAGEGDDGTKV